MSERTAADGLAAAVARWQGLRVLVLGDALLDDWQYGEPDRLCREAPVPVVSVGRTECAPGGAANTAVNVAALGAHPVLVAPVGDDAEGALLRRRLADVGVETYPVVVSGWRTPVKRRVVAGDQLVVRLDEGPARELPPRARRTLRALTEAAMALPPAAVVLCDYGYGALDADLFGWLLERRDDLAMLAVDAHHLGRWAKLRPTVVTPSFAEALDLLDPAAARGAAARDRAGVVEPRAADLLERTGAKTVAVTLDADGALVVSRDHEPVRTTARPAAASHAVGAGDAYLAALTLAMATGADPPAAARLAQAAATTAINGPGTCVCGRSDLLTTLAEKAYGPARRVLDAEELVARLRADRARGARVVFTNGCFDVLHAGHVGFLEQARALGDVLVVAVNSDASVRRLKGDDRPVNGQDDRTVVLAALSCVDYVTVFDESTPARLIEQVRPDVYVKGGDYRPELLAEAPLVRRLGGTVRILDYLPDRSTSAVIERIRSRQTSAAPAGTGPTSTPR